MRKNWTAEEDITLRQLAGQKTSFEVALAMGRTRKSVSSRAEQLKISIGTHRRWSSEDEAVIRSMAADGKNRHDIAAVLGVPPKAITDKARCWKLFSARFWTEAEDNLLRQATALPKIPGRNRVSVMRRCKILGLKLVKPQPRHSLEAIERIRHYIEVENKSAGLVAQLEGITKNAVIGLCSRAGITFPESSRLRRPLNDGSFRPKKQRKPREPKKPSLRVIKARVVPVVEAPPPGALPLWELQKHDCRWPYGGGPFLFCGAESHLGSSYCPYHTRIAWLSLAEPAPFQQSSLAG